MTCAHLFDSCLSSNIDGETVYQSGQYVGTVAAHSNSRDWAIVEESESSSISGFNNTVEDQYSDSGGRISNDGLQDRLGQSLTKQGVETCETSGTLDQINMDIDVDCDGDGYTDYNIPDCIEIDADNIPGDSGAPIFDTYTSGSCTLLLIAGLANYSGNNCTPTIGPSAESIRNNTSPAIDFYSDSADCYGL